ncbi:hypothetical protein BDF21DRAFT_400950 [Thamnidium elegans]|nr:hypothetical protein BDF21DRAFT_400950 [Thamnidium elegans]
MFYASDIERILMSNINYDTFHNQLVESPSTYYPTAIPPDPLERYGSGHLDLDIFGISVSRLSNVQQLAFVRKVMTITACQFLTLAFMIFFIVTYIYLVYTFNTCFCYGNDSYLAIMCTILFAYDFNKNDFIINFFSFDGIGVSKLAYEEGILVIVMSGFGLICSLLYTFQKRYYFRGAFPFLGAICLSSTWLRYVYDMDPLEILYPITISSVICSYVILEIYYIMKNVTSDDYLLANVYFFVDLVYPMRFIHHFCELTDNMNMFPEILYPGEIRA